MSEPTKAYHRDRAIHHIKRLIELEAVEDLQAVSAAIRRFNAPQLRKTLKIIKGDRDE